MAQRLSKSDYAKLSASGKKKLRASLARASGRKSRSKASSAVGVKKGTRYSVTGSSTPQPWHKGLASAAGRALGSYFGPVGASLGSAAGDYFSRLTGFGDYRVQSNSLIGMGTDPPAFKDKGRNTIITHREFIQDVVGSTAFSIQSFPINAGMANTFPWASQIAQNFEQYRIRGMVYEFKTTSATSLVSGTNTAMGTVIMATEYNAANPAFTSKAQMENHEFCTSSIPSQSFVHAIECKPSLTTISTQYVRSTAPPAGVDIRMYDLGNFQIATVGMQNANIIGELWVSFEIELIKPVLFEALGAGIYEDHYRLGSTATTSAYFGTAPALQTGSNFGTTVSGSVLTLPAESYPYYAYVMYEIVGVSTVLTNPINPVASGSATLLPIFTGSTTVRNASGATTPCAFVYMKVAVAAGSAGIITITSGTLPTGIVGGDLVVVQANPAVLTRSRALPSPLVAAESDSEDDEEDEEYEAFLRWRMSKKERDESKQPVSTDPLHLPLPEDPPVKVKVSSRK